jgi:steroid delta-isomerase-like uncharacterized protein
MSSSVSVTLLRHYYQLFNSGDRKALLALLADDVVHEVNQGGKEVGRDVFERFFERMDRCYREQVVELTVFANDDGTRGAAEFYIEGAYLATDDGLPPATGQTYRLRVGAFFEMRDGKISRVTNYYNLAEWLAAVGA